MTSGQLIRNHRKKKKLTQLQLGKMTGMSQQQIGQYENGIRFPKIVTLIKLSKALECDIFDLVDIYQEAAINQEATP